MGRRLTIVFIILLVLALVPYIAVAFFVHPFADDFSYAVAGMRTELLSRLWDEYRFWNGRWFSNMLVLRGPLVLGMEKGLWLYRLVPIVLLALTWTGAFTLLRNVAPTLDRSKTSIGASLFLLLYLQLMPDLSEGIYWYTGAVSYQLPGALMLFLFAGWVRILAAGREPAAGMVAINAMLAAIIAGCNELHMVFMVLLHAILLLFRWRSKRKFERSLVIALLVTVGAAAVMILAPGNAGRGGQFPHKHEVLRTFGWGALQTARFACTWIFSPALLIMSVLYIWTCRWLGARAPLAQGAFGLRPWTALLILAGFLFVAMVLPYWATGLLGQHRTVNAALLWSLPLWFVALNSIDLHWLRKRQFAPVNGRALAFGCGLLAASFLFPGNGGRVTMDLVSGRMTRFDRGLIERYELLGEARDRGDAAVTLAPVPVLPRSLRYLDGTPDSGHWINRSIAYYFNADSMAVHIETAPVGSTAPPAPL